MNETKEMTDTDIEAFFVRMAIDLDKMPEYRNPVDFSLAFKRCSALEMNPVIYRASASESISKDTFYYA